MDVERRAAVELRAAQGRRLVGYAATFGSRAQIFDFSEEIAPGAFKASLASGGDVVGLVDHDPGRLLARTRSGTLRLAEDQRGLSYELDLPNTQLANDVLALVERGDIGGMSFGFITREDTWKGSHRTLRQVDLIDVSIVQSFPAYPQTSVSARSRLQSKRLPLALAGLYLGLLR